MTEGDNVAALCNKTVKLQVRKKNPHSGERRSRNAKTIENVAAIVQNPALVERRSHGPSYSTSGGLGSKVCSLHIMGLGNLSLSKNIYIKWDDLPKLRFQLWDRDP